MISHVIKLLKLNRKRLNSTMNTEKPEYPHILSYRKLKSLKSKVKSTMENGMLTPSLLRKLAKEMDYQKTLEKWMKNMNCLPLPRELQIKIMEYDVNHRKSFKLTLERIRAKAAVRITNNVINRWCNRYRYGLNPIRQMEYINIHVPDKECMFNGLNSCKCCERHQTNRPVFGEYPAYDTDNQDMYRCKCRCRQNMRNLSRARFLETEGHEPDPRLGAPLPGSFVPPPPTPPIQPIHRNTYTAGAPMDGIPSFRVDEDTGEMRLPNGQWVPYDLRRLLIAHGLNPEHYPNVW